MARHKDYQWNLPENSGKVGYHSWESINAAILMDIRDELKRLNTLLHCPNFTAIPTRLERIARNTTKKKRKP